ncbi:hypothetical protein ACH3XW_9035 [Acanthocheilonema viteae]
MAQISATMKRVIWISCRNNIASSTHQRIAFWIIIDLVMKWKKDYVNGNGVGDDDDVVYKKIKCDKMFYLCLSCS